MLKEAIIIAGGLGTRLRSVVNEQPKSMAPVADKPFLEYLLDYLIQQGIQRFILSVGYQSEAIINHFKDTYKNCEIVYALEEEPLGTGGAIKNAMKMVMEDQVLVTNGDSLFQVDLQKQFTFHQHKNADVTLALKPMKDFDRYGRIEMDGDDRIMAFREKEYTEEGLINGGVYLFDVAAFRNQQMPQKFSVEKNYFEAGTDRMKFYGFISEGYFLDIGIPEDFAKAQHEFKKLNLF